MNEASVKQGANPQEQPSQWSTEIESTNPPLDTQSKEALLGKLSSIGEASWQRCGLLWFKMGDGHQALVCLEKALKLNPNSISTLKHLGHVLSDLEQHTKAIECYQKLLSLSAETPDVLHPLYHCYFMLGDFQKAFRGYQQSYSDPSIPPENFTETFWYDIGVLFELSGQFENARSAFCKLLTMNPTQEKRSDSLFRLALLYKEQENFSRAVQCLRSILNNPPASVTRGDLWFHIGTIYELERDSQSSLAAFGQVTPSDPTFAKALQQIGWIKHRLSTDEMERRAACLDLLRSVDLDPTDAQSWYLLGRCYVTEKKYRKAYDSYQQAILRDQHNPAYLCSVGTLYFQMNQLQDAFNAYLHALRYGPNLPEVWYNLGVLYHSSENIHDALAAFSKAAELDPTNVALQEKLKQLRMQHSEPK